MSHWVGVWDEEITNGKDCMVDDPIICLFPLFDSVQEIGRYRLVISKIFFWKSG